MERQCVVSSRLGPESTHDRLLAPRVILHGSSQKTAAVDKAKAELTSIEQKLKELRSESKEADKGREDTVRPLLASIWIVTSASQAYQPVSQLRTVRKASAARSVELGAGRIGQAQGRARRVWSR